MKVEFANGALRQILRIQLRKSVMLKDTTPFGFESRIRQSTHRVVSVIFAVYLFKLYTFCGLLYISLSKDNVKPDELYQYV